MNVMLLPSVESAAAFPFISTSRTLPFPSAQADWSLAENSEKEDCEMERSRRDCADAARREEAAYTMPNAERKIRKTRRVSIEACARRLQPAAARMGLPHTHFFVYVSQALDAQSASAVQ